MASEPLISIALCTYNGARHLREQIDSLLAQTHRNVEIVIADDRSTDATTSILQEYAERDARVRYVVNAQNLGFAKNFESVLAACGGDFVAPCDQDDLWLPDKLAALLEAIGPRALAYCDSEFIAEDGEPLGRAMSDSFTMISTDDPLVFAEANCVSGHALLARRELVQRALPIPAPFYYDWWLAAVAASAGGVVYCPRKLVNYRLHGGNVTNDLRSRARQRGDRWRQLRQMRARLEWLAKLPGPQQRRIEQLRDLWTARETQWVSPRLAYAVFEDAPRLLAMKKDPPPRFRFAVKFALGLAFKRLASPYGYAPTPVD